MSLEQRTQIGDVTVGDVHGSTIQIGTQNSERHLTVEDEMEILRRRERAKERHEAGKNFPAMMVTLIVGAALLITLRFYPEEFSLLARAFIEQMIPHPHHASASP